MQNVSQRWGEIHKSIDAVSKGRTITVIGVSKFQSSENLQEAIRVGLVDIGVNYAQDGELLRHRFASDKLRWHFIGHIQSRKVKYLTEYDCIQSIDRIEIANHLDKRVQELGRKIEVLVEVNIAGEPQKSGVTPLVLPVFLNQLAQCQNLTIKGLMAMPPAHPLSEDRRVYFRGLFELFETHRGKYSLEVLSMGTSEDYLIAISEGATMVRLGTSLFGPRK